MPLSRDPTPYSNTTTWQRSASYIMVLCITIEAGIVPHCGNATIGV